LTHEEKAVTNILNTISLKNFVFMALLFKIV